MSFESMAEWCKAGADKGLFEAAVAEEMADGGLGRDEVLGKMARLWSVMKESAKNYDGDLRSQSGLSGGDAAKFKAYKSAFFGDFLSSVIYYALAIAESNACMKCIVASPTAGSCGVLPAVLIPFAARAGGSAESEAKIIEALFVSGGIGEVIAKKASIAGAECGCQAEIGAASAMAAGALAYLQDGDAETVCNACAIAMKGLLGLVCDPVAGLVEVPCVKRNVIGAVNAVTSADLALSGIKSRIPADEVFEAMKSVGLSLPKSLKETAEGGLAATATARALQAALL